MSKTVLCPRCEQNLYTPYGEKLDTERMFLMGNDVLIPASDAPHYPALSRTDNETYICSDCGTHEALMDFTRDRLPEPSEWPLEGIYSEVKEA